MVPSFWLNGLLATDKDRRELVGLHFGLQFVQFLLQDPVFLNLFREHFLLELL